MAFFCCALLWNAGSTGNMCDSRFWCRRAAERETAAQLRFRLIVVGYLTFFSVWPAAASCSRDYWEKVFRCCYYSTLNSTLCGWRSIDQNKFYTTLHIYWIYVERIWFLGFFIFQTRRAHSRALCLARKKINFQYRVWAAAGPDISEQYKWKLKYRHESR